jgi:O-antigen ligase
MTKHKPLLALLFTSLFAVPVLSTLAYPSTATNFLGSWLMLTVAGAGLLVLKDKQVENSPRFSRTFFVYAFLMAGIIIGWLAQGIEFWSEPKMLTFVAALILYLVYSRILARNEDVLNLLVKTKLSVLVMLSILFVLYIYLATIVPERSIKESPPIFLHLRHFNYELYFGLVLAGYCILTGRKNLVLSIVLFLFVFLSIWSGGRGAILGLGVAMTFLIAFSRHLNIWRLSTILLAFALVATIIIFATGKQYLLVNTVDYTMSTKPATITAGRTHFWWDSINAVVSRGPVAILTGLGPDAFRHYDIVPTYVQPHNSLIQAFMEFGLIGLGILLSILARFTILSVKIARASRNPAHHLAGAMFVGGVAFSMVTGILHHVFPLAMMMFTMAFLKASSVELDKAQAESFNPSLNE